ncbi:cysteine desulfurase [Oceanobacillus caeni]|uniref:Cysteine desulfurase n=1 Tax=Oceanobacillus caeni TaxID=405946 RepID=A0ABR5MLA6_9BACI|nr:MULTISPECIES: cysteine desulfurase family protein [Bacillaceae]KKE79077.1 cysteine desulfurase [Bacilli bacterium VT-13-104]PZD86231.1 cysteine desulfurase [Bacilli bacterium]KPH76763.1 cysteine desulfurase [Oceanobacillus caeni]MBU8792359.1 cysteine desulfurase [Oceanobacillus caeni]MCR1834217.1 cysteine desulfurase [Oceanobacillus caeni]
MIYLDNSATTRPDPSVLESFNQVSTQYYSNPSSIHQFGGLAEKLLITAKTQAADLLHVEKEEIIFTSGGTEGNNIAIKGIALEHQNRGKHIITSEIEHPSIYEACEGLKKLGFEITYLPVDEQGIISLKDLKNAIREDTILISIMHVNNEIGSIQPIKEIGEIAKHYPKLFFHVDDVQGLGKVPLNLKKHGIDLCTYSGHKIHGLKGTGLLYVNRRTKLFPLFHGGGQELNIRSGTENLAGIVAMVKALRLIKEKEKNEGSKMYQLQQYIIQEVKKIDGVTVNTPKNAAPHIVNISVPGVKPEVIIHMLGKQDIFISTKSACSSKSKDESKVLVACGFKADRSTSALRISLSYDNTMEEIKTFITELKRAINEFKQALE